MSQNPLLLSPETTVQEVAELMNRYGFEGYPVVEDGRVIGLLNRRNVDRALHHKLDATTRELMDSGEVSVVPEDSISYLQELMTASGWGQVPVLEKSMAKSSASLRVRTCWARYTLRRIFRRRMRLSPGLRMPCHLLVCNS